jgi:N-acetylmuramoyl-L-alanine amidase
MAFWRVLRASGKAAAAVALLAISALALQDSGKETGPLAVTAVRHWSLGETTRIAIEVSGEFEYRHGQLTDPERLYFDIQGARSAVSKQRVHTIAVADGLLRQIRVSETQPGTTRVVLDLELPVDFVAAQLANPDRLVVELRRRGPPARKEAPPAAAAEPPPAAPPVKAEAKEAASKPAESNMPVPVPAKRNTAGTRSLVRALGLKLGRVVLDPGHGGHDTGTIGPGGLMEKDLVLDVAQRLGALIEERLGAEVVYTRTGDTSVSLEERTALANQKQADLFLSIHANSGINTAAGSETYYLSFTTSRTALDVAARENASSNRNIRELQVLIEKIALKDKVEESREFAAKVQASLYKGLLGVNSQSRDRGVRKAPFEVLIEALMPSVLTEIAFLSNPREERLLKSPDYRQKIAEALCQGVAQYASTLSRFQVAQRQDP